MKCLSSPSKIQENHGLNGFVTGLVLVQIVVLHLRRWYQVAWKEKRWQPFILAMLSDIVIRHYTIAGHIFVCYEVDVEVGLNWCLGFLRGKSIRSLAEKDFLQMRVSSLQIEYWTREYQSWDSAF